MIRTTMFAAALATTGLLFTVPAAAQSQADLNARYDRALAAGYKAMFLCSAIANAELFGAPRSIGSVESWELTGIQAPLHGIVEALPAMIERGADDVIDFVSVLFANDMLPRVAMHRPDRGCSILPIGAQAPEPDTEIFLRNAARFGAFALEPAVPENGVLAEAGFGPIYGADARTTAVVILREGKLIGEAYGSDHGPNVPQRTWSVAKSIAATLVGAAVYRGEADVTYSAGLGEGERDPRATITIDHALRMASGRYTDTPGNRTDPLYYGGATVDEVAVDWPLITEPGSTYRYANNDTLAAMQAIEHTFSDLPPSALLDAFGMDHTIAETDWQGNYILSSQVWSTARDLAQLGQLHLDDGILPDGTRILPEDWVEYVSTPSGPQPNGASGWGYGAGWWLLNNSEGIPADTILAAGNRGQFIVVIPSRDLVIVRRGEDPAGGSGFDIEAFTRDVLGALDE
ncbi:serine hydrolase domain-containing protein [Aurantiacibacter marinus]|uniref:Beta-lactamase n=1 Tax=Aurantiacibacter marinus TaxID=874156 RepID=A0A0H0XTE0_9SPHN|nr:serine hydrolase [Aurantiacibacter marinus]KLI63560.1 beta-lactamase [Aurantiacibacter marinus]